MEIKPWNKICDYRRKCCIPTPRIDLKTVYTQTMRSVMDV